MNFKKLLFPSIMGIVGVFSFCSCKDDDESGKKRESNIDKFVSSLQVPYQPDVQVGTVDSSYIERSSGEICTYQEYSSGASFDENFLLDPSTDVIYPGALIDGASITTGDYAPIVIARAPITIYTNFKNKDGELFKVVSNPNGATINQAIKELLYDDNINGSTPAQVNFEVKEIVDKDQLDLELGVSINAKKFEFTNKFNFSQSSSKRNFLIKYVQPMYNISIVSPNKPNDWFAKDVSSSDLSQAISSKAMPCYVGSVSYGRAVYALMQTEEKNSKIAEELKSSLNLFVKGQVDTNLEKYKSSTSYSYSGTIIGGNADAAAKGVKSIDDILDFVSSQGNFGKENPAEMLAYKLNKLSDGSTFAMKKAAKYTIKNCESFSGGIKLEYIEAMTGEHGGGDGLEPYGDIKIHLNGTQYTIFTMLESQNFSIIKGQKLDIQGKGNNASVGGKSCYTNDGPNLNLDNVEDFYVGINLTDKDGKNNKNDPYFTYAGTKYGESVNKLFGYKVSSETVSSYIFREAIDKLKSGASHKETFFVDVYRVYDKEKYDIHDRNDFFDNPETLRLHFSISLE